MARLPVVLNEAARYSITASLLYSAYIVYTCPCAAPVACRQTAFYWLTATPVAAVWLLNNVA